MMLAMAECHITVAGDDQTPGSQLSEYGRRRSEIMKNTVTRQVKKANARLSLEALRTRDNALEVFTLV